MLSCTILAVGSLREKALRELATAYQKRLGPFMKLEWKEVSASKLGVENREKVLKEEGDRLLQSLPPTATYVLLTEHGHTHTSEAFAEQLTQWSHQERQSLCFIVGGAFGLDTRLQAKAHHLLSLSPMTFPHEWARLLLLEQLYRGCTIRHRKTYHY